MKAKRHNKLWDRAQQMYYDDPATGPIWSHLSEERRGEWYMKAREEYRQVKKLAKELHRADYQAQNISDEEAIPWDELAKSVRRFWKDRARKKIERKPPRQPFTWSGPVQGPPNVDPPMPTLHALAHARPSLATQAPFAAVTTPFLQNGPIKDMDEVTRRGKIVAYNEIKMAMAMRTSDLAVKGDAIHPETAQAMARGVEILANLLDMLEVHPDA